MRLLKAWARAEGGTAAFNPLNTTEPWRGATDYNSAGVKNYPSGRAGIAATVATLDNGYYKGIVHDLRWPHNYSAREMVERNAHEFDTWGTGASHVLGVLAGM
jgi:hypothetical protein